MISLSMPESAVAVRALEESKYRPGLALVPQVTYQGKSYLAIADGYQLVMFRSALYPEGAELRWATTRSGGKSRSRVEITKRTSDVNGPNVQGIVDGLTNILGEPQDASFNRDLIRDIARIKTRRAPLYGLLLPGRKGELYPTFTNGGIEGLTLLDGSYMAQALNWCLNGPSHEDRQAQVVARFHQWEPAIRPVVFEGHVDKDEPPVRMAILMPMHMDSESVGRIDFAKLQEAA